MVSEQIKPLDFFTSNVDAWGAAEWFDRLAKAIREQDKAVVAENKMGFETYRMIAASSAMTLVREFEQEVRAALAAEARATAAEAQVARIERETIERCAKIAQGKSAEFDFGSAMAECRDGEHGFHSGCLHAAAAIRFTAATTQEPHDAK